MVAHTCDLITFRMRQQKEDLCEFKASLDCIVLTPSQPQLQCESLSQKTQTQQIPDFFLISGIRLKLEEEEAHIKWAGGGWGAGCLLVLVFSNVYSAKQKSTLLDSCLLSSVQEGQSVRGQWGRQPWCQLGVSVTCLSCGEAAANSPRKLPLAGEAERPATETNQEPFGS